jgi:hypothetical protein
LGPSLLYFTRLTVVCRAVSFITLFELSCNVLDFNLTVQLKVKYEWRYTSTPNTLSRRVQGTTLLYTRRFRSLEAMFWIINPLVPDFFFNFSTPCM